MPNADTLSHLVALARTLGEPWREYAILGEGNVSARLDGASFLVKASGTSLAAATPETFARIDLARALALVQAPPADDAETAAALGACQIDVPADARPSAGAGVAHMRPSVETGLHAVLLARAGARWIAHTHPTAITGMLCSERAPALVQGALFPDQVVVCGRHPLLLPYVDPGLPLARELLVALDIHTSEHGAAPKAIYLQNHGFVALGQSAAEVLAITEMAVKAAQVLAAALACGGPRYLPAHEADRIAGRADEHHRQRVLGLTAGD